MTCVRRKGVTYLRSGVGMKSRRTCVTESLLSALHGDNPCRIVLCGASGAHGCSVTGHGRKGRFRLRCCGNECDTTATAPVRADNPRRADRIVWLFDPKAPNEGRTAGLLTRSGRHAFPSPAGGGGGDCAAFVLSLIHIQMCIRDRYGRGRRQYRSWGNRPGSRRLRRSSRCLLPADG